jgi:hypothetical protein
MEARQQRVDGLARRLIHPAARLAQQRRDAVALAVRLDRAYRSQIAAATHALREQGGRLRGSCVVRCRTLRDSRRCGMRCCARPRSRSSAAGAEP